MTLDYLKKFALALLKEYERALMENAGLRRIIDSAPMVDGTTTV
jgi:hypothetical protein